MRGNGERCLSLRRDMSQLYSLKQCIDGMDGSVGALFSFWGRMKRLHREGRLFSDHYLQFDLFFCQILRIDVDTSTKRRYNYYC